MEVANSLLRTKHVCFVVLLVMLAVRTIQAPPVEFGDGREYILQTQSIVLDGALEIDPERVGTYFNQTNPYGVKLTWSDNRTAAPSGAMYGGGFGGLYWARDGSLRFIHSWVYSAVVAPLYAALHIVSPGSGEYLAFPVANLLFMFIPLTLLWRIQPSWGALAFFLAVFMSPITPHLAWAHSEIFCFFCVSTAFALVVGPRGRIFSPLLLGLGAAQNPPIVLFFPLHFWLSVRRSGSLCWRDGASIIRQFVPYFTALLIPAALSLQTYSLFGEWNVIAAWGFADPSNVTLSRLISLFVSPILGVLWYFPFVLLSAALVYAKRERFELLFCVLSAISVAAVAATTANINSAQLSAPRYAIWFVSPLSCLPFLCGAFSFRSWTTMGKVTVVGTSLLCVLIAAWLGTYRFIWGEWMSFFSINRARPEVAALYRVTKFDDDVEVLVENIQGRELLLPHQFDGVYIWNLGARRSLWIVSKRAFQRGLPLRVRLRPARPSFLSELSAVFAVQEGSAGGDSLVLRAREGVSFARHPYFGAYAALWLDAEVTSARGVGRVFVR